MKNNLKWINLTDSNTILNCLSLESIAEHVQLHGMSIDNLVEKVTAQLVHQKYECYQKHMQDNQGSFIVQKNKSKTLVAITRPSHRSFEVEIVADLKAAYRKPIVRTTRPHNRRFNIFRWEVLLVVMFAGALLAGIIGASIGYFINFYRNAFGTISPTVEIITVITSTLVIIIIWVVGIPYLIRFRKQQLYTFNNTVLKKCVQIVNEIQASMNTTPVRRCWSCFQELSAAEKICPHCHAKQK